MYVWMDGWMDGWMYVCMYVGTYVRTYVCMYVFVMLATNHFGTGHHHWYVSDNLGFPKSLSHRS